MSSRRYLKKSRKIWINCVQKSAPFLSCPIPRKCIVPAKSNRYLKLKLTKKGHSSHRAVLVSTSLAGLVTIGRNERISQRKFQCFPRSCSIYLTPCVTLSYIMIFLQKHVILGTHNFTILNCSCHRLF